MFGWLKRRMPVPAGVDLRLDRVTKAQRAALNAFLDWGTELVDHNKFRLTVEHDDTTFTLTLRRDADQPEWLRCTVRGDIYVEEDQQDRRVLSEHCTLFVDCKYSQTDDGPEVSMEAPLTSVNVAKARREVARLLASYAKLDV